MKKGLLLVLTILVSFQAYADDITLVKHAKRAVLANNEDKSLYTVRPNDTLYKILANSLGAKPEEMPYLYHQFKLLNPGIKNLNMIQSNQKVVLPKRAAGTISSSKSTELKEVGKDYYTIKQGEHIIRILKRVYKLSDDDINKEYLKAISELNPDIKNLNHVIPGQRIKMPKALAEKTPTKEKSVSLPKQQIVPSSVPVAEKPTVFSATGQTGVKPDSKISQEKPAPKIQPQEKTDKAPVAAMAEKTSSDTKPPAAAGDESSKPQPSSPAAQSIKTSPVKADAAADKRAKAAKIIKNSLIPAFTEMGASSREEGKYYMPVSGGNVTINTQEIPVLELDTGKKVILDYNKKISPKVKSLIEKTFPDCTIISDTGTDLEAVMDKVLSVSGYFSINKDGDPIIVGSEEKVRLSGKWIVYKDFTRSSVYVINLLGDNQPKTPKTITEYASRFGLDIIDIGGKDPGLDVSKRTPKEMGHSYKTLFDELDVKYKKDLEIDLLDEDSVHISYKAPLLAGKTIITSSRIDDDINDMLVKKGYKILNSNTVSLSDVIDALGLAHTGPPLKIDVADKRAEIEVPAIKIDRRIILEKKIDISIVKYLSSTGAEVLIW